MEQHLASEPTDQTKSRRRRPNQHEDPPDNRPPKKEIENEDADTVSLPPPKKRRKEVQRQNDTHDRKYPYQGSVLQNNYAPRKE
jgi:hypothetical protein